MFEIDARGFSRSEPVILVKKAIEDGEEIIEVKVRGDFARDNVIRMAESLGCSTSQEEMEGHFLVRIEAGQGRKIRLSRSRWSKRA
ncbi:MAG: sulfurtransferase TusA family protein [Actinomycetota bacterium]|nr:sulfurtransferase TusA family protein [Actinomycetota bacterium]